jgi:diguanylate cyclase (GGDEF)-like protein
MLSPSCEACGCQLRAATAEEFKAIAPTLVEREHPITRRGDVTAVFAVLVSTPFVLPLLGVNMSDIAFAVPFAMLCFATVACVAAARLTVARRSMWLSFAVGCGFAAAASAVAVVSAIAGWKPTAAFYLGLGGSLGLLAGAVQVAHRSLRDARFERVVDSLFFCGVAAGVGTYFIAIPGFAHGDAILTWVFLVDLVSLLLVGVAVIVRRERGHRRLAYWLTGACAAALIGDGLVSEEAARQVSSATALTAAFWAAAGYALAAAALTENARPETAAEPPDPTSGWRWLVSRVVLPLTAVLALPAVALCVWLVNGALDAWQVAYFGAFFLIAFVVAFGRQAHLLVEKGRAVSRERELRHEMMRRNAELEALTGLATTMTQTLEEAPIVEQALGVLHLAARATSSALHVSVNGALELEATTGDWQTDHPWVSKPTLDEQLIQMETRGGRSITRVRLEAREHTIGVVTFVRPATDAIDDARLRLLSLLVDQMAIAVQNARDYREKLEQAIRDPLTGVYNRRFFFEALDKEVRRQERYGSSASLVLLDVDDFKQINDSFGHAKGDEVLRQIARIGTDLLRPVDSFARIGGEEFAMLLPETQQLDALLVAERLRTAVSRSAMVPDRRVTISGGVASCPQDAREREDLEKKADAALYWAKRNGKDLCAVASEAVGASEPEKGDGMLAHLYAMVSSIDARQMHTRDHSENVAAYAVAIGQALGLNRDRIMRLRRAALLHDIGKITVPRYVLAKPGPLDKEQFALIARHPELGGTMLAHAGLADEALWIRHHHERIDGNGYPSKLAGDTIPVEARIIFVADSFEAMTSDRPYRPGMDTADAVAELKRCAGTQFDPRIVSVLEDLIDRGEMAVLALRNDAPADATAR